MKRPDQIVYKMCAVVSVREARHCGSEVLNRREVIIDTEAFVYTKAI
jgi:hypothetical protein